MRFTSTEWPQIGVDVVSLSAENHDAFETFVSQHPDGLMYYSLRYAEFLKRLLGCRQRYWLAVDQAGNVRGVLPLMEARAEDGSAVLNSLPFYGSHGGILADSANAHERLLRKYVEETTAKEVVSSTIVEHPFRPLQGEIPATFIDRRISQITDIGMPVDRLIASFEGSTRRNINKARSSGVVVSIDNRAWEFLEQTHRENMQAISGHAKEHKFFDVIPRIFQRRDRLQHICRHEGRERHCRNIAFVLRQSGRIFCSGGVA